MTQQGHEGGALQSASGPVGGAGAFFFHPPISPLATCQPTHRRPHPVCIPLHSFRAFLSPLLK